MLSFCVIAPKSWATSKHGKVADSMVRLIINMQEIARLSAKETPQITGSDAEKGKNRQWELTVLLGW